MTQFFAQDFKPQSAPQVRTMLWKNFVIGVINPGIATIVMCFLCLELSWAQWMYLFPMIPAGVALYSIPEAFLVRRQFEPIIAAVASLDTPSPNLQGIGKALVSALNLPYQGFVRIFLLRGSLGSVSAYLSLVISNIFFGGTFQTWQIIMFPALVALFACPAYAMMEYFRISRTLVPVVERLWTYCPRLAVAEQNQLITIKLKSKLLYLCVFITSLPLLFVVCSIMYKVHMLLRSLAVDDTLEMMSPLLRWTAGALVVCLVGAFAVSMMMAQEVSRAAARLIRGMNEVERGNLDIDLKVLGTDEYADLTRGFNLMTDGLRDEGRILEVGQSLAGELHLDVLIRRILAAATELMDAERATLFVHSPEKKELFSRYTDGAAVREIRIPENAGIAGAVFSSGILENITDPYSDSRFNQNIDKQTGFITRSILCIPITNKSGTRIGVTQLLNKNTGVFTAKDVQRLSAFTAQIAVTLENARLFDEVLSVKNYNENILSSTTNGVITLNNNRAFVTANEAARHILGMENRNLFDTDLQERFTNDNPWVVQSVIKVEETSESVVVMDTELIQPDGTKAFVNLTVAPLRNAQGKNIGTMLNFEDFTREKRVKTTMARYMSKEVAEALLAAGESALGGQLQTVSVMFSDIRGFTNIAETLGAKSTVSMLNEYFEQMVEVIFSNAGILDKYIGDAMMALFGAPFEAPDDADRAVATANGMLQALKVLNQVRTNSGRPEMHIGIGIATGEVIVGNIGSPRRLEYTVIGDSVNLASRLEGATKQYGVRVLLSESTVLALTVPTPLRKIDDIRVKGKDRPVKVYEALAHYEQLHTPEFTAGLTHYEYGLVAYSERDFIAAEQHFTEALAAFGTDTPSSIYLTRSQQYQQQPPPSDWDGVFNLHQK